MKRKLKWLAIVLAVLLLGFGTALLLSPRDRITAESWQKIRMGMTEEEVEDILGGPGMNRQEFLAKFDQVRDHLIYGDSFVEPDWENNDEKQNKIWFARRGFLAVQFDQAGHARRKLFQATRSTDPSFFDRLRDWLGYRREWNNEVRAR